MIEGSILSLGDAAGKYLAGLPAEEKTSAQAALLKFVRWLGPERQLSALSPAELDDYAESLSLSDAEYARKLETARAFLAWAKKERLTPINLSVHIKSKKGKMRSAPSCQPVKAGMLLTAEGYAELEAELATLHGKRSETIEEIRKAAADKDFRENAPLQAAREQRSHIEGRIMKLEETLKSALVINDEAKSEPKITVGTGVVLRDLASGEEIRYMLVGSREIDPLKGKISSSSPIGQALNGRGQGEVIEVNAPGGKLRYEIVRVEC